MFWGAKVATKTEILLYQHDSAFVAEMHHVFYHHRSHDHTGRLVDCISALVVQSLFGYYLDGIPGHHLVETYPSALPIHGGKAFSSLLKRL